MSRYTSDILSQLSQREKERDLLPPSFLSYISLAFFLSFSFSLCLSSSSLHFILSVCIIDVINF